MPAKSSKTLQLEQVAADLRKQADSEEKRARFKRKNIARLTSEAEFIEQQVVDLRANAERVQWLAS